MEKTKEILCIRRHLLDKKTYMVNSLKSKIIFMLRAYLEGKGFIELFPVIASPITDPLSSPSEAVFFDVYGHRFQLTKSMIFHKQLSMLTFEKIYIFSPNFRIEPSEKATTSRHLLEFVQLDLEIREASREEVIDFIEEMLIYLFERIQQEEEISFFGRKLPRLKRPFPRITYSEAVKKYGDDFENRLSEKASQPVWVIDFPYQVREFYYREDPQTGTMVDFDLLYPEGFGEAISGGEREWRPERLKRMLMKKGIDLDFYDIYLSLIEEGIPPSAGFGIGIERLTRFLSGVKDIKFTRLFPKLPGRFGI